MDFMETLFIDGLQSVLLCNDTHNASWSFLSNLKSSCFSVCGEATVEAAVVTCIYSVLVLRDTGPVCMFFYYDYCF